MARPKNGYEKYRERLLLDVGSQKLYDHGTINEVSLMGVVEETQRILRSGEVYSEDYLPVYKGISTTVPKQSFYRYWKDKDEYLHIMYERFYERYFEVNDGTFPQDSYATTYDGVWFELHPGALVSEWKAEVLGEIRSKQDQITKEFVNIALILEKRIIKQEYTVEDLCIALRAYMNGIKLRSLGDVAIGTDVNCGDDYIFGNYRDKYTTILNVGFRAIFEEFTESYVEDYSI